MVTESQIYRNLQKHIDKLPIGFQSTEPGVEIRILKHLFTPEEAALATQLSETPESLVRIHKRIIKKNQMPIGELEQMLDRMVKRGVIWVIEKSNQKLYGIIPFAIEMF